MALSAVLCLIGPLSRRSLPVARQPPIQLKAPPPPSPFPYRKLAGRFVDASANDGDAWDDSSVGGLSGGSSEGGSDGNDVGTQDGSDVRLPGDWSSRAQTAQACWAQPEYREAVLAKRAATSASKRSKLPPKPPRPPLSPSLQRRSDAIRLLRTDEEAWLTQRLAAGAERRDLLNNDDAKRRKQLERSEAARKRHVQRKAKAAAESREARKRKLKSKAKDKTAPAAKET